MLRVACGVTLAVVCLLRPAPARADSQAFAPVADAYVSSADAASNNGSGTRLWVEGTPTVRTLLRFDVRLPAGADVTDATLRLYTGWGSTLVGYQAYAVDDSTWDETSVTYASAPPFGAELGTSGGWDTSGYKDVRLPPGYIHSGLNSIGAGTSAVSAKTFWSREAGANPPQLVVDYSTGPQVPPASTSPPTVAGTARDGETLTADPGSWDGTQPMALSYRWQRCGTLVGCGGIIGATGKALVLTPADVGATVRVVVTASNAAGDATASSDETAPVAAAAPANTSRPTISGTLRDGASVTAGPGGWSGTPPISYGYQWRRCDATGAGCTDLAGATARTYALTAADVGATIGVEVTASNAAGSARSASPASAVVEPSLDGGGGPYPLRGVYDRDFSSTGFADEARIGFDLIDSGPNTVDDLSGGSRGMVWVGDYDNSTCSWAVSDSSLRSAVSAHAGDPKLGVWFISDEPDPTACPDAPAQHKARTALIHSIDPSATVLVVLDSNSGRGSLDQLPKWVGSADVFGLDPYTCYQGQSGCNLSFIDTLAAAADAVDLPYWGVVQAFGDPSGSGYWFTSLDAAGAARSGHARLPSADELRQEFAHWRATNMKGYLVFAWHWPRSDSSLWLANHPELRSQLAVENGASTPLPDTSPPTAPAGLSATGATTTSISVAWQASSDDAGVAGYGMYRGAGRIDSTSSRSYTFSGLTCATTYELAVDAYDAAGNRSPQARITAHTSPCPPPPSSSDPVITAAGDIAGTPRDSAATAALIEQIAPTRVLTLGDNAYPDGTSSDYADYYDPNWGRFKSSTSPVPGNHDYQTAGGAGYFDYFGAQAPAEYYSFDVGSWHLIALDGEIGHSASSAQESWLRADLAAHPARCTLAYWHEPRFSSGSVHGNNSSFDTVWRDLYAAGADVVLNGHDHEYERFAPQDPAAQPDPNGIREFVAGTGGASLYSFSTPVANSEVRDSTTFGVLELTLHPSSYDWRFVPVAGGAFSDSGSQSCH